VSQSSSLGRWLAAAGVYAILALIYARTLLPVIGSALPNDLGDPGLNTWILWWNAHAVPLTSRWWDAPMFFPVRGAIALSETFLNLWPLSSPMQWAGASAVLTYNVMYLLSFPAAALAAHALAHRLTGRHDAGFVAGLAFGFAPYRAAQVPHLQTLWSCWMPLALLALHRYLDERRPRDLWLFALCWLMNGLATGYYLFYFSMLAGAWMLWFVRERRDWIAIGGAAALATALLAPLLVGYGHYQSALGLARGVEEIKFFSADLTSIWATTPLVLSSHWTIDPGPEGELYPGAIVLALIAAASVAAWRGHQAARGSRVRPWLFAGSAVMGVAAYLTWPIANLTHRVLGVRVTLAHPPRVVYLTFAVLLSAAGVLWNARLIGGWRRRSLLLFYALAAALMLLFALGPEARAFHTTFLYWSPYGALMHLPGGHAFRVPARFGMLLALCVSQAAAVALVRLTTRGVSLALVASICAGILLEGFMLKLPTASTPPAIQFFGVDRGAVVLEMPVPDETADQFAMLRATRTGHALVNGFSGYIPPHYEYFKDGLAAFDPGVIRVLQQFGPLLVFVHQHRDDADRYRQFINDLPGVHPVRTTDDGTLFQLPLRPVNVAMQDPPLTIVSAVANASKDSSGAMLDDDLASRWEAPQRLGTEVTLTFDRPVTVSRLELDLGAARRDYPHKLRVSAGDPGQAPVVVWERSVIVAAMLGALSDAMRMPLALDLSPQVRGRQLTLTLLNDDPELIWAIAGVRAFGR
jgi:hypothetical protein